MIDFIRIQYKDKSVIEPFILSDTNFKDLHVCLEYHSGEIKYPYLAKLENMDIIIYDKSVYVKNSLHKLKNYRQGNGDQNHNDFNYSELVLEIDYLCKKLVDLNSADITRLEFGLNIDVHKSAKDIIINNVLMHNYSGDNQHKKFNGKGEYKQYENSNFYIKVYDKAKQYNRYSNILRFEIKFINKKEFIPLGIKYIGDLKNKTNLESMFSYLLKRFDEMNIIDTLNSENIPLEDYKSLEMFTNSSFWDKMKDRKLRNKKMSLKKTFNDLLFKYDLLQTKRYIRSQLENKFKFLLNN